MNRHRNWFFKKYQYQKNDIKIILALNSKRLAMKTDQDILTGIIVFYNAVSLEFCKSSLKGCSCKPCKNIFEAKCFVRTLNDPTTRRWIKGFPIPKIKMISDKVMKWQKDILTLADAKNDLHIHWYWDRYGCLEKTTLIKHLFYFKNAVVFYNINNMTLHEIAELRKRRPISTIVFVFRSNQKKSINYDLLGYLKIGVFVADEYCCIMDPPNIIIFSDFQPMILNNSILVHDPE